MRFFCKIGIHDYEVLERREAELYQATFGIQTGTVMGEVVLCKCKHCGKFSAYVCDASGNYSNVDADFVRRKFGEV